MGELKSQEFIFEHENSLEWSFDLSGTKFWQWKFDDNENSSIEGLKVDFSKSVNLIHWPCDWIFGAP